MLVVYLIEFIFFNQRFALLMQIFFVNKYTHNDDDMGRGASRLLNRASNATATTSFCNRNQWNRDEMINRILSL